MKLMRGWMNGKDKVSNSNRGCWAAACSHHAGYKNKNRRKKLVNSVDSGKSFRDLLTQTK